MESTNNPNEFHETITDQKEIEALKNFKNSLATITSEDRKLIKFK